MAARRPPLDGGRRGEVSDRLAGIHARLGLLAPDADVWARQERDTRKHDPDWDAVCTCGAPNGFLHAPESYPGTCRLWRDGRC